MSSGRPLLRNRSLLRLLCGFGLMNVSEWGFIAALSVHAYNEGGTLDVGLIGVRFLAGAVSSALIAPLVASRRGLLGLVALLRAILLGGAAAAAIGGSPFGVVLIFVVADAIVAATYRPAQSRLMPSLAHSPQELTQAVAATSMAKTVGQALGALLGGMAVALISPPAVMACEAAVMLLSLACTFRLGGTPAADAGSASSRLRQGLAAFPGVLSDAAAWPLVVASVLRTLVRGLWGALLVVVALRLLHAADSSVGLLQAASGLGVLFALPVTASQIGRPRLGVPCIASFVAAGLALALIGTASALSVVAVLVFIWGAAMAIADATSLSLLHRLLPTKAFSRTVAVMESLKLLAEGVGALLAPALVAIFGLRAALVIAGLPLPVLMITTWVRVRRSDQLAAGRGSIVARLHRAPLFRGLDMASLEQLAANTQPGEAHPGDEPVVQGAAGDRFYVIDIGEAEVVIDGFRVRQIGASDDFGERALLRDTPRTATIRALTEMHLLTIERDAFLEALTGESGVAFEAPDRLDVPLIEVLQALAPFEALDAGSLRRLADGARRRELAAGTTVFDVGDPSNCAYVILSGRVELQRDGQVTSVLLPGDIFGELSALHGTPRAGRAMVAVKAIVSVLPANAILEETRLANA